MDTEQLDRLIRKAGRLGWVIDNLRDDEVEGTADCSRLAYRLLVHQVCMARIALEMMGEEIVPETVQSLATRISRRFFEAISEEMADCPLDMKSSINEVDKARALRQVLLRSHGSCTSRAGVTGLYLAAYCLLAKDNEFEPQDEAVSELVDLFLRRLGMDTPVPSPGNN